MSNAPPRRGSRWDTERSKHDWKLVARLVSATPGEWVHAASDVASGTVQRVRNGQIIPLQDLGGKVEATCRHSALVGTTRYGDLYIRWTPDEQDNGKDETHG